MNVDRVMDEIRHLGERAGGTGMAMLKIETVGSAFPHYGASRVEILIWISFANGQSGTWEGTELSDVLHEAHEGVRAHLAAQP